MTFSYVCVKDLYLNESDEKFSLIIVPFGSFSSHKEKNQMDVITVFIHADFRAGSDSVRL